MKKLTYEELEQRIRALEPLETQWAQLEKSLKENAEQYRAIVENSPDVIMRFDRNYRHIYVSPSIKKIADITPEDAIGKTHEEFGFPHHIAKYWEDNIQRVFDTGISVHDEFEYKGSGKTILFDWLMAPEFDTDGKVKTVLLIAHDDTERSKTEKELRHHKETLEKSIRESTYELIQVNEHLKKEIADRKNAEKKLRNRLQWEEFIVSLSAQFINLDLNVIDSEITNALERINTFAGIDRSYILQVRGKESGFAKTHERCGDSIQQHTRAWDDSSFAILPQWADTLRQFGVIHIPDVAGLSSRENPEKEHLESLGIQSILLLPMMYGHELIGVLGCELVAARMDWMEEDSIFLKLVAEIFSNVLKHQRIEEELRESEKRFLLAHRAANIGSWDWDISSGKLHWSELIEPLFGFIPGEFEGTYAAFLKCIYPDDRQAVEDAVAAAIERGVEYTIEHRIIWKNGTIRWVSEIGDVIRDDNGNAVRMLGIVQDITDRKRMDIAFQKAHKLLEKRVDKRSKELSKTKKELLEEIIERKQIEANLVDQNNFLQSLMNAIPNPMYYKNVDGIFVGCNTAFEKALGIHKKDLISKTIFDVSPKDLAERQHEMDQLLFKHPTVQEYVDKVLFADGKRHDIIFKKAPFYKSDGSIGGLVGILSDITEQKRLEEELKNSNEQLRIIFDAAPDAYYISDFLGNFIDGNKAAERISGYSKFELIGKNFLRLNLLPATQIAKAASALALNAMGKSTGPDEFTLRRKDGTTVALEIRTHPVKLQGKNCVLGIARDIPER